MTDTETVEDTLAARIRAWLPAPLAGPLVFILKQAWAALFAILILTAVMFTNAIWADDWRVARYDALFGFALLTQAAMLLFKLETWAEARVILLFHITGTCMEYFKVSAGSWSYPEEAFFVILGVPMFSGFMYASVGSYIARVIRLFDLRFTPYPPFWMTVVLAVAIYVNFFAHHFTIDIRLGLFAATVLLFWRTRIVFNLGRTHRVPLPFAALVASFFLWIAENIGTHTGTWTYAGMAEHDWTPIGKLGSWYLLIYVAFVTVTIVVRAPLDIKESRATSES